MNRLKRIILTFSLALTSSLVAQITVSGTVTDASTGKALAGANVVVEGTNKGSAADANGEFTIGNVSNGSEKINGGQGGISLSTEGEGLTLVYIDSTIGWRSIQDNDFATAGSNFIQATGGTVTCVGNCKIHTFTGPGSFINSN